MVNKFCGFKDIKDPQVIEKIRERLEAGIPEEPNSPRGCYTEKELMDLVDKINEVAKAVDAGLPNEMYDMLINVTDVDIAYEACERHAIWLAHEGKHYAKKCIQEWTDDIKSKIDRITEEGLEKLENKMFLREPIAK